MNSKKKYIQNAKNIIDMLNIHTFDIKMWSFCSMDNTKYLEEHPCGTTYCLAGYQAKLDNYPKKYRKSSRICTFNYLDYSADLCGYDWESISEEHWDFIYGGYWPDSKEGAIARCQYVIDHDGDIPPIEEWEAMGWSCEEGDEVEVDEH